MKKTVIFLFLLTLAINNLLLAFPTYVGYSGAPGSKGTCASSCHGTTGGTIAISNFPSFYEPLKQYTIKVYHTSGTTIMNFNLSIRIGTGSANAGTLSAGLNTVTYNTTGETNGIHLSTTSVDSATFIWTSPDTGTGSVKLYLGGLQGTSSSGQNTTLVLSAAEFTSVGEENSTNAPKAFSLSQNFPNPFNLATEIEFDLYHSGFVTLEIYDILGRRIKTLLKENLSPGHKSVFWDGRDSQGREVASGIYFYRIQAGDFADFRKMVLMK